MATSYIIQARPDTWVVGYDRTHQCVVTGPKHQAKLFLTMPAAARWAKSHADCGHGLTTAAMSYWRLDKITSGPGKGRSRVTEVEWPTPKYKAGDRVIVSWEDAPDEAGVYCDNYGRGDHHVLVADGVTTVNNTHLKRVVGGGNVFTASKLHAV